MKVVDILKTLFGTSPASQESVIVNILGNKTAERNYANPTATNRSLSRQLYHNTNNAYALAAQLVKPIINNNANFIGKPKLFGNKKALAVIDAVNIDYSKIHKSIEIDGDIFIWPQWDNEKQCIKLVYVPIDVINEVFVDPETKEVVGYRLLERVLYSTSEERNKSITIEFVITKSIIAKSVTGAYTSKTIMPNPLNRIPIVHFSNDRGTTEKFGHAEIENIIPQLKFYHDLTFEAGAAQSRDGHPKLKVTSGNVKQWIENNFGAGTYTKVRSGEMTLTMDDRDLFINAEGDDVSYLYLNKTSGDYSNLSEVAFTNIVEGSETPEINFGANIGTSLASVKEYRPVWIKKIEAKQYDRTLPWTEVFAVIIDIHNFVNVKNIKNDVTLTWPRPNFASIKEQSEIVQAFATAIDKLRARNIITREEVYDTLKKLDIFELYSTYKEHEEEIIKEMEDENKKADEEAARNSPEDEPATDEGGAEEDEGDEEDV